MSRLTNKKLVDLKYGEFLAISKEEYRKQVHEAPTYKEIYTKLGKFEDLQDELGCPLDVVFKALKEGSIEDEDGGIQIVGITIGGDGELYLHAINGDLYLLKDYQKKWWLKGDRSE